MKASRFALLAFAGLAPALLALALPAQAKPQKADTVFLHGYVYTVDAADSVAEAVAVRDGQIVYVGGDDGARALIGKATRVVDLSGRLLMPGLIDGHMHPQAGGLRMLGCNLDYAALTQAEFQARIQKCVDDDKTAGPDDWLIVINWFEQGAKPEGTVMTRAALDAVRTTRPIKVHSSFGHSDLTNTRGLKLAGITRDTPDPKDGTIVRDASGEPTGLLQEAAQDLIDKLIPAPSVEMNYKATQLALKAMREQGITSFLDAYTDIETLTAYSTVVREGGLTARGHFAVLIDSPEGYDAGKAVAEVLRQKAEFDRPGVGPAPGMTVDTAKLFLDGVYSAPAYSAMMIQPYFEHGRPGHNRGPKPFFTDDQLQDTLIRLAAVGLNPHMHAEGDGSVRQGLNAVAAMRKVHPGSDIRPAIAHDEIVHPDDFSRFAEVGALPVLSFQWERPSVDIEQSKPALGPVRAALMEPAALLDINGARIVYGSDWPVDALNEWLALQIAVTRTAIGDDAVKYPGRLGIDPGLSVAQAVRAITLNAAYSLRQEDQTGSVEVGKLADLIVLDRNLFKIKPEEIGGTQVLLTMVGGKVVYQTLK
ncbi:hypothetical protein AEAC466_10360 [Asticcacaulis sp. AC466]|uniref:amidohydrolase n=1 Tax=Asticcacaulis sp. AC466 TaxID=1282362 RepID=UPI0003C3EA6F|nr:amidohydrolase [Asticcacaulis sp. AC466]ESQ84140.1 hypothetical protein AEAC466_10360 [Asticcacaulis sp. AC466]